jgi:hypothetical protein
MKIKIEPWEYTCGEPGCCYDWGYQLIVDGVSLGDDFTSEADALSHVLVEILGHTVEESW